jgi:hypothetical protein
MLIPIRVIDTIQINARLTHHFPEFEAREGVIAILDPDRIQEVPEIIGQTVMIWRCEGSVKQLVVSGAVAHHSIVGIFFEGASSEDLIPGAELQW